VLINYAESFDTVRRTCRRVKPTVVLSVPRLYEKVYARVLENRAVGQRDQARHLLLAKRAGEDWATHHLAGLRVRAASRSRKRSPISSCSRKLQARTGGRIRFFVSGAAPLSADIAKFFYSAGCP